MNCSQVRASLAEYRELKNAIAASAIPFRYASELEAHLEGCAACQQALAQQALIGERIRALPAIKPSATAYQQLMQTLATEHVRYLQHISPAVPPPPTPTFLMPYLREQAHKTARIDTLTTLSTADTGPLPVIQPPRRHPRRSSLNHLAIIGVAAAVLMLLMTGGLTSLLLLANHGISTAPISISINNPTQVSLANYSIATSYPHVATAVANRDAIYYAARGDGETGWMLQRFDVNSRTITSLLTNESDTPLIVLSANQNWLVWLDLGPTKPSTNQLATFQISAHTRTWNLNALYLGVSQTTGQAKPIRLLHGTFDESMVPTWIHTPIQGTWFIQNTLLVTSIDDKGVSQIWSYRLKPQQTATPNLIDKAHTNGHILSSPTANNTGSNIYWAEEWQSDDTVLHSNIWIQTNITVAPVYAGKWAPRALSHISLLRNDGMSFHPQVVNETLFFLSTNPGDNVDAPQTTTQSGASTADAATQTAPTTSMATITQRVETALSMNQLDQMITGTLMAYSALGAQAVAQDNNGIEFALQGGSRFLLWESSTKGFEMYDAFAQTAVPISNAIPKDALFLTVSGDSVVWMGKDAADKASSTSPTITFSMFNWPTVSLNSVDRS